MSPWGWSPERTVDIWRYGPTWLRPFAVAVPYLTVVVLLLQLHFVSGTFMTAKGLLFDLPASDLRDGEVTGLVTLVVPMAHETMLFFDDSRYSLDDPSSVRAFGEHLSVCVARSEEKTLLVLADRRVAGGDLMKLASVARANGVAKILFAEKGEAQPE